MWIDQHGSEILDRNEALRLLALVAHERGIARLGIPTPGAPLIIPVNYTYDDAGVLIRLAKGAIANIVAGSLVAIEIDRVDESMGEAWSVLLRGHARLIHHGPGVVTRRPIPDPLSPIPGDLVVFIRGDDVTGRRFALTKPRTDALELSGN